MSTKPIKLLSAIAIATSLFAAAPAFAGEASLGEDVFRKCQGCHKVGEGAKNASGPVLNEIVGRTAGTFEGYRYGDDLVAAGVAGLVWDEDNIEEYLEDPRGFLRDFLNDPSARIKMSFRLRDEEDRENVAAYLATL